MDQPTPTPQGNQPVTCPLCAVTMLREQKHALDLDRCPQCRGLWFDGSELDAYITGEGRSHAAPLHELVRLPDAGALLCPRCATPTLESWRSGPVFLSRCQHCLGVFLEGADVRALSGRRPVYQVPRPAGVLRRNLGWVEIPVEGALEIIVGALLDWT